MRANTGPVAYEAAMAALKEGYRHIDTAALYGNEADVGKAVRDSGVPREEVFITTKLWAMGLKGDGYSYAMKQAEDSMRKLGTYIDLYLIHSPHHPSERMAMWRALEDLKKAGKVRSIGVSNYGQHHLDEILSSPSTTFAPAVNQVELHPYLLRADLAKYCASKGIKVQAWAPLVQAMKMDEPILQQIAKAHGKTPAQVSPIIVLGSVEPHQSRPAYGSGIRARDNLGTNTACERRHRRQQNGLGGALSLILVCLFRMNHPRRCLLPVGANPQQAELSTHLRVVNDCPSPAA